MENEGIDRPRTPPAFRVELIEMLGGRTVAVTKPMASVRALQDRVAELEAENARLKAREAWLAWLR